jgi:murein DD-endopeptidase MepM/ murein hydrolase activator NlpD
MLAVGGCAAAELESQPVSRIRVWNAGECPPMEWPVDAALSSTFGMRDGRPHEGIDLAAPEGSQVHAACDGVVAYAGDRLRGYGRLVIVDHGAGLATVYAHNSKLLVREGDAVSRGRVIALSGQTGHATAPHVHFEVRQDSRPRDPLKYLPPRHDGRPNGRSNWQAEAAHPRRAGLSETGDPLQGRDPAARERGGVSLEH